MAMTAFPDDAAAAGRRQARIMKAVNVPMRAVLRLPFPTPLSANLMLISYTGVKSGKAYRQPVSYARDGETLLTPGGGRWTLNLKDGRKVRLRLRGRDVPAHADLVRRARRGGATARRHRRRQPARDAVHPAAAPRRTAASTRTRLRPPSATASASSAGTWTVNRRTPVHATRSLSDRDGAVIAGQMRETATEPGDLPRFVSIYRKCFPAGTTIE